jgi:hypothetical protein
MHDEENVLREILAFILGPAKGSNPARDFVEVPLVNVLESSSRSNGARGPVDRMSQEVADGHGLWSHFDSRGLAA